MQYEWTRTITPVSEEQHVLYSDQQLVIQIGFNLKSCKLGKLFVHFVNKFTYVTFESRE